ncbi:MAG: response regulator [Actinomycetia bacterium]|nr:response regulator [Actinomycetes bacterium]MCP4960752.1 response regulator [Actinomycetes bacterium]
MKGLSELRVLLVEDNEIDARSLNRILDRDTSTSFHVEHVADLAGALASLDEGAYDCILLDLSLPDSEGLDSIDRIVAASPAAPIVVLTGYDDPAVAVQAVDHGAQDYLFKQTVDTDSAGRSIRYAVARHHAEHQLFAAQARLRIMDDRDRIARDLHDTVIQQLFATGMTLHATVEGVADEAVRATLTQCVDGIDVAIAQLRHAIFELHQPTDQLTDAIDEITRSVSASLGFDPDVVVNRSDNAMTVTSAIQRDMAATLREALANVAHHAEATATMIAVNVDEDRVTLEVSDNGRGARATEEHQDEFRGNGLLNMQRRALTHGGTFDFGTSPEGSTVRWIVPSD